MQYQIKTKTHNVIFNDITTIEWMELDLDKDSDRLSIAIEVAAAVEDWNGEGKIDAYRLDGEPSNHEIIYEIWQKLEELREPPKIKVEREGKNLLITGDKFHCRMKGLTIIQYIDVTGKLRRKNPEETAGYFKCLAIAENLLDWNDQGRVTASDLYENRDNHKYVAAIDVAVTQFFRKSTSSIRESIRVLDDSGSNGGDDNTKPSTVESKNGKDFGLSRDLERV